MLKRILIGIFLLIEVTSFSQIDLLKSTIMEKSVETEYFNRPTNFKQSIHLADSLYAVYLIEPFYFKVEQSTSISDGLSLVLNLYHKALNYKPKSKDCQKKIDEVEQLFKTKTEADIEAQIMKLIKKADECYALKDFVAAKELYTRLLSFKPEYEYAKQRIMEIEKILKSHE